MTSEKARTCVIYTNNTSVTPAFSSILNDSHNSITVIGSQFYKSDTLKFLIEKYRGSARKISARSHDIIITSCLYSIPAQYIGWETMRIIGSITAAAGYHARSARRCSVSRSRAIWFRARGSLRIVFEPNVSLSRGCEPQPENLSLTRRCPARVLPIYRCGMARCCCFSRIQPLSMRADLRDAGGEPNFQRAAAVL